MWEARGDDLGDTHDLGLVDALWASANALLWLVAVGWTMLGRALRSECDTDPQCDDWVMADAVAVGVAFLALLPWALPHRHRRSWLSLATVSLLVPAFHILFI
ncbi:MAG: hypothetical protein ACRDK0_01555 [Solirubrobacteraceae bacterium]